MQDQVRAIKFRPLAEDELWQRIQSSNGGGQTTTKETPNINNNCDNHNSRKEDISCQNVPQDEGTRSILSRRSKMKLVDESNKCNYNRKDDNFLLKSSQPALLFDQVCFEVDATGQQHGSLLASLIPDPRNWWWAFGRRKPKVQILKSIKLSVAQGSILGLLGPSSCGKTTLLRCLVGLLEPTSGDIKFSPSLAAKPGRGVPEIPGRDIGYMPQELALYDDFSIRRLLLTYGQYVGMSDEAIEQQVRFLAKFLDLPGVNREIGSLSGGQKRRVSLAIALLHSPSLIILDEPTVGVDPLLRKSIWKYLRRMASEQGRTIVITTHYIEEAGQADQVALMRQGEILVQGPPAAIMAANKCSTLEEAFLQICSQAEAKTKLAHSEVSGTLGITSEDAKNSFLSANVGSGNELPGSSGKQWTCVSSATSLKGRDSSPELCMAPLPVGDSSSIGQEEMSNRSEQSQQIPLQKQNADKHDRHQVKPRRYKRPKPHLTFSESLSKHLSVMYAIASKNFRRNLKSWPLLAFQFLLPVIQMVSFSLCVGGRPSNVGLGLVNKDLGFGPTLNNNNSFSNSRAALIATTKPTAYSLIPEITTTGSSEETETIDDQPLSFSYLAHVDRQMLQIRPYATLEQALEDVRRAKLWAAMEIGPNFTVATLNRFEAGDFSFESSDSSSSLGGLLDTSIISQSTIRLYPDRSNRVLDSLCLRSLSQSYREFLAENFIQFRRLPIELREAVFDIEPNLISNSINGYTESIAAGLLASLTYIMAAGLTTFIMVLERSTGVLERTYAAGVSPVVFLLAHTLLRSLVMMVQIAMVLMLTFYVIRQPLEGSIWLAYGMLMWLNLSGIAFGVLVSSIVREQNGAALTIVSSLVVKLTLSGILWPLEAVPYALRWLAWLQPLTLPVQALKLITLKGSTIGDPIVCLAFISTGIWLLLFLTVASKQFKFYQH